MLSGRYGRRLRQPPEAAGAVPEEINVEWPRASWRPYKATDRARHLPLLATLGRKKHRRGQRMMLALAGKLAVKKRLEEPVLSALRGVRMSGARYRRLSHG